MIHVGGVSLSTQLRLKTHQTQPADNKNGIVEAIILIFWLNTPTNKINKAKTPGNAMPMNAQRLLGSF